MRLIKTKYVNLLQFNESFNLDTGMQEYTSIPQSGELLQEGDKYYVLQEDGVSKVLIYTLYSNLEATILPFKASMVPDFQIDLARMKDHWMLYSNQKISSDQSDVVQINGLYYTPLYSENTKYADPRHGYFKTIIKFGVDQKYGLTND